MTVEMASLFDTIDGKFKPGDIVRQSWPWIGRYEQIYPYLQVREQRYDIEAGQMTYICASVPYGWMPDAWWFREKDLFPTGLSWRIPTDEEIDSWFHAIGTNRYVAKINGHIHELPQEAELVEMLQTLPVPYDAVTRDNFYELFPREASERCQY